MKTIHTRTLLATCFLLLLVSATAQAQDFMPLRIDGFPGTHLTDPPPVGQAGENMQIAFYNISVGGVLPLTKGDTRFMAGLRYENLRVDLLDDEGFILFTPDHLHYLRADLLLFQRLSEQWTLGLTFAPGIASDFDEIGSDDLRFQASAMLLRRANDRLGYGFGAAYLSDFGTPLVIPMLRVDYESASHLKFSAMLPVNAYLGYAFSPNTELGLAGTISGTQYNINLDPDRLPGNIQPAVATPDDIDLPAKYSVLTVGPSFKQRVRGPFFVAAEAGMTLWRRFEFDGDQVDNTLDQDRSLFLRFGIAYRPNFKLY